MREALELVSFPQVLDRLPMGLQTLVSEGTLERSERQQLLLARALAARPEALVLDEAMSAIPTWLQAKILQACRKRGIATVVVSHHPETLALADRKLILNA